MAKKPTRRAVAARSAKNEPDMIAKAVSAAIAAQGLTIYRVSEDTEIHWDSLNRWLDGRRSIHASKAAKVLVYLKLEVKPE